MKSYILLILFLLSVYIPTDVWAQKITIFGASIKNSINAVSAEAGNAKTGTQQIIYPRPGEIIFTTQKYCGDGDVANYYAQNPQEDYARGAASMALVIGYWVVPQGSSSLPTANNWFAMGYNDIGVGSYTKELHRANKKAITKASVVYLDEISSVLKQVNRSSSKSTYNIYSATMICTKYTDINGSKPNFDTPTAAQIASSLIDISGNIKMMTGLSADKTKLNLDIQSDRIQMKSGGGGLFGGGGTTVDNAYQDLALRLDKADYPFDKMLVTQIQKAATDCKDRLANNGKINYWWESLPLDLTCQMMDVDQAQSLLTQLQNKDEKTAKEAVDPLLQLLMKTALMEQAQVQIQNDSSLVKNKISCVPPSGYYINTIMASLGFPYNSTNNYSFSISNPGNMSMPEGNYALGAYAAYRNDQKAVFMDDQIKPMVVKGGVTYDVLTDLGINFNLHVRDVGCGNGIMYCKNERSSSLTDTQ